MERSVFDFGTAMPASTRNREINGRLVVHGIRTVPREHRRQLAINQKSMFWP